VVRLARKYKKHKVSEEVEKLKQLMAFRKRKKRKKKRKGSGDDGVSKTNSSNSKIKVNVMSIKELENVHYQSKRDRFQNRKLSIMSFVSQELEEMTNLNFGDSEYHHFQLRFKVVDARCLILAFFKREYDLAHGLIQEDESSQEIVPSLPPELEDLEDTITSSSELDSVHRTFSNLNTTKE
jgi:hypothetical protein